MLSNLTLFALMAALVGTVGALSAKPEGLNATTDSIGLWYWTWSSSATPPAGSNFGVAFSGWTNPWSALSDSAGVYHKLTGNKYISLGGGNSNGRFSLSSLNDINSAINSNAFSAYHGVVFDIEEGDSGLYDMFATCFKSCQNKGLKVLVTVSHSAPYGINDAYSLMMSILGNSNVDYISPQLYSTGEESSNEFETTAGVSWSAYANTKAAVIPSIVKADYYWDAAGYLSTQGVNCQGFVQWQQ